MSKKVKKLVKRWLQRKNKSYDSLLQALLDTVADADKASYEWNYYVCKVLIKLQRLDEAETYLENIQKINPESINTYDLHAKFAEVYSGDFEKFSYHYYQLPESYALPKEDLKFFGKILLKHNRIDDAKRKFEEILSIDKDDITSNIYLGKICLAENNYNKAEEYFKYANKFNITNLDDKSIMLIGMASCILQHGRKGSAIDIMRLSIKTFEEFLLQHKDIIKNFSASSEKEELYSKEIASTSHNIQYGHSSIKATISDELKRELDGKTLEKFNAALASGRIARSNGQSGVKRIGNSYLELKIRGSHGRGNRRLIGDVETNPAGEKNMVFSKFKPRHS